MTTNLLILTLLSAGVDWAAVAAKRRRVEYVAKPLTLVLLILWYLQNLPKPYPSIGLLILVGLICSLLGDIFLLLPDDFFIAGLIAFLIAHIGYIAGFLTIGIAWQSGLLILALLIAIPTVLILRRMWKALIAAGHRRLSYAVLIYGIGIALMLWTASATLFQRNWPTSAGRLLATGGLLFFISDSLLGWNRFVKPVPGGRLVEMMTYHLAQFAIAAGILLGL
jgi:uncharacterized membrane protein YhhN